MALFTISDLHLPLGVNKPMDIFGPQWENYVARLEEHWQDCVKPEDVVVLPGDFSWATYLEESVRDFAFLNRLNGRKILLKGNHDYWWTTLHKMRTFIAAQGFSGIDFLQNNSYMYQKTAICGTRGWAWAKEMAAEDQKIYNRELNRLELSIQSALRQEPEEVLVFLHYPPVLADDFHTPMAELLQRYGVKRCIYGHIHASGSRYAFEGTAGNVQYTLVSCDFRGFYPIQLCE
ncbi:MAG TPA: metallophosphoesterase [Candidatus Avimonoglobus intestinipullorum]|uniref:Metallophosphoesterase n=1 Tax=Candidatus Avimonoglobus intestinipullorum TaxID=2840699 RepID=A0A9D1LU14_9FIRM|nr:metallophosphoesterase [Candidatus Avimonoglobus intestinipullorum]